jgi:hypothetical protein
VAIGRELHPRRQPVRHVLHEAAGVLGIAPTDSPGNHQLRVGIQCGPRPAIASAFRRVLGSRDVLRLRVDERPDFIALDALGPNAATVSLWNASQAAPASASSFDTVLIETSATRLTDRMEEPSTSIERI